MWLFWFLTPTDIKPRPKKGFEQPSPTFPSDLPATAVRCGRSKPSRKSKLPEGANSPDPAAIEYEPIQLQARLLAVAPEALSDQELLEMVLAHHFPLRDIGSLVGSLLSRFGSFSSVIAAPRSDLQAIEGLGESGLTALKTVQAAALRLIRAEVINRPLLNNWDRLMDYLIAVLARERVEQFRVLFLDTRNRLLADEPQARGTIDQTSVYPREVAKRSLELNATALILVHNHPSGDTAPSRPDIEMTRELREAVHTIGIVVHDHVIIGNGQWMSLRREGFL